MKSFLFRSIAVTSLLLIPCLTYAGGSVTKTRGTSATISWSVANAPSCSPDTNYPSGAGDGVYSTWKGNTKAGSDSLTLTGLYSVGTWTFNCTDLNSGVSDTVYLYINDCGSGTTWNGTSCVSLPDLRAGGITPITATSGTSVTLSSTIYNNGQASTGSSFWVLFQRADDAEGNGAQTIDTVSISAIAGGSNRVASVSYTFPAGQVYYVRACADKNAPANMGTITETNENNNCGDSINSVDWTPVDTRVSGILQIPWSTCTIATSTGRCSGSQSIMGWTTQNSTNTVTVSEASGIFSPYTARSSNGTIPIFSVPGTYTINLKHGNDVLDSETKTVSCPNTTDWNGSACVPVPPTNNSTLTCNYTSPCSVTVSCTDTYTYSVQYQDGTYLANNVAYSAPTNVPISNQGNYTVTCRNSLSMDKVLYYSPYPTPPSALSLTATPRSLDSGGKVTLSWGLTDPNNSCRLIATPVCTGTCGQAQLADIASITSALNSGNTDSNDPGGVRSITSALQTPLPSLGNKTTGKKTLQIYYTTDFKMGCLDVATTTLRVQITKPNEG